MSNSTGSDLTSLDRTCGRAYAHVARGHLDVRIYVQLQCARTNLSVDFDLVVLTTYQQTVSCRAGSIPMVAQY